MLSFAILFFILLSLLIRGLENLFYPEKFNAVEQLETVETEL